MRKESVALSGSITDLKLLGAKAVIGGETITTTGMQALVEFTLLHSYPKSNSNRQALALKLLARHGASVKYQPFSQEHRMEGNPGLEIKDSTGDVILGVMVGYEIEGLEDFGDDIPLIPDEALAFKVTAILWKRKSEVRDMMKEMRGGIEYGVSMEAMFNADRTAYAAGSEIFTPEHEDYDTLAEKWSEGEFFNGLMISQLVGGTGEHENDWLILWGGTATKNPADEEAKFHRLVAKRGSTMAIKMEDYKVVILTNGKLSDAKILINQDEVEGDLDSLSAYGWDDGDGDDDVSVSWSTQLRKNDIVERKSFRYEPESSSAKATTEEEAMQEHKAIATEVVKMLEEQGLKSAEAVKAVQAKVAEGFKDFKSPEAFETAVATCLKNIGEREVKFHDENIKLTAERAGKIRGFSFDETGDLKFNEYLGTVKSGLGEMKAKLTEAKVEVTDAIEAIIADFDGVNDARFVAVSAALVKSSGIAIADTPADGDASIASQEADTKEKNYA